MNICLRNPRLTPYLLLFFLLSSLPAYTQQWQWFNGSTNDDYARGHAIVSDRDNNAYITGVLSNSAQLDDTLLFTGHQEYNDYFIAKYNEVGKLEWASALSQEDYNHVESGEEIALHEEHLYVAGRADNHILLKYDLSGNLIWGSHTGYSIQKAHDLAIDQEGAIYITGTFEDTLNFENHPLIAEQGQRHAFLAKYNQDGEVLWTQQFGNSDFDRGYQVSTDEDSHIYLLMGFKDSIEIGTQVYYSIERYDYLLIKLDQEGNLLWSKTFGSTDGSFTEEIFQNMDVDQDNNVYIVGNVEEDLHIDGNLFPTDQRTTFLIKIDENGILKWVKEYPIHRGRLTFDDISIHKNLLFLTGRFYGRSLQFDSIELSTGILGITESLVVNLDLEGNFLGLLQSGCLYDNDWWYGFHFNEWTEEIYLTGAFREEVCFDSLSFESSSYTINMVVAKHSGIPRTSLNNTTIEKENKLLIYPNPVIDQLKFLADKNGINRISIYALNGIILFDQVYPSPKDMEVDLQELPRGLYIVELTDGLDHRLRKKIIKM